MSVRLTRAQRRRNYYLNLRSYKLRNNTQRRISARWDSHIQRYKEYFDYGIITDVDNLAEAFYRQCRKNLKWKKSIQEFDQHLLYNCICLSDKLNHLEVPWEEYKRFPVNERGKIRQIAAPGLDERVTQNCMVNNVLYPVMLPSLIYDNGACLKGKGIGFTRKRLVKHLTDYMLTNKTHDGYILLIDFHGYFANIDHENVMYEYNHRLFNEHILYIISRYMYLFNPEGVGVGLGSTLSQLSALLLPNRLDHAMKEKFHMKYYGRYNDDIYIIHQSREVLEQLLQEIIKICDMLKIRLNTNKTKICRLSQGFTFLKCRYFVSQKKRSITKGEGRIMKFSGRRNANHQKGKLYELNYRINKHTATFQEFHNQYKSWRNSTIKEFDCRRIIKSMDNYYYKLTNQRYDPNRKFNRWGFIYQRYIDANAELQRIN